MSYVKIGVGGPVGSGKTALIERLTRKMSKEYSICVVTNDIYTKEDAEFLIKNSAKEIKKECSVIVIEHDMDFVKQIADKVTVLHEGKILMEGGVKEVLADPTVQKVYLGRGGE